MSTEHAREADAVAQTDPETATSRREQAARDSHHVGETWSLDTDSASYTGLVTGEALVEGVAEWTLLIDADTDETVTVSWDAVDSAEQVTPDCPICATAGWKICYQHGGQT